MGEITLTDDQQYLKDYGYRYTGKVKVSDGSGNTVPLTTGLLDKIHADNGWHNYTPRFTPKEGEQYDKDLAYAEAFYKDVYYRGELNPNNYITKLVSLGYKIELGDIERFKKPPRYYVYDKGFWVRLFGRILNVVDIRAQSDGFCHKPLFAEVRGFKNILRVGSYSIQYLPKDKSKI